MFLIDAPRFSADCQSTQGLKGFITLITTKGTIQLSTAKIESERPIVPWAS